MKKSIRFAYAVNADNRFELKHFGNAEKYLIREWTGNEISFKEELINSFVNMNDDSGDGFTAKGIAITDMLKRHSVKVLISRQFGKNIQMVNNSFIPVIINSETIDEVDAVLSKHMRWIESELNGKPKEYKLFSIRKGIFKTNIRKSV